MSTPRDTLPPPLPKRSSGQLAPGSVQVCGTATGGPFPYAIDQCPAPTVDLANGLRVRGGPAWLLPTPLIQLVELVELAEETANLDLAVSAFGPVAGFHPQLRSDRLI